MVHEAEDRAFWLSTKIVLQDAMDNQLHLVVDTLANKKLGKVALLEYAENAKQYARLRVLVAAEAMEIENFAFDAWAGPQGAGKGSMHLAIRQAADEFIKKENKNIPPSLDKLIKNCSGDMGEIMTGTGGIFYKPKPDSEYEKFFERIGQVSSPYTTIGELVPDAVVSTMVFETIGRRILQGNSGVEMDLYPRDKEQHSDLVKLMQKLEDVGVSSTLTIVDLRLLPQETINLISENKQAYSEAAVKVGEIYADFYNREKDTALTNKDRFEKIDKFLFAWEKFFSKGSPEWWLVQETKVAIKRMKGRAREDDNPLAIMKRLASYYGMTMPGLVMIDGVKFVSADQAPEGVITDLVSILVGPEDKESEAVKEFIRIAQEKAIAIVNS